MIIKNIKWYIIAILLFSFIVITPITFSKYTKTLSKSLMLNITPNDKIAYFKEYDGNSNFLGFDKTNITSFSRNTTLTREQVLNKDGVQLISNTEEDDYKSEHEIYGWLENNDFYWWSDADKAYFHPKTINAFRYMTNLVTIDLTDVSTSKVENFSYWFYLDSKLLTLKGKINTSGIVLDKNISEHATSVKDMFNGCSKLKYIDTSEFDTKNATDMYEMFRECKSLIELDVSHFDTSNVLRMNAMFYNCSNLEHLDVTNFDTRKVSHLSFMFYGCSKLKELDVSSFDTTKIFELMYMFFGCSSLKYLDVSNFSTKNSSDDSHMFYDSAEIIILGKDFDLGNRADISNMFQSTRLRVIYAKTDFTIPSDAVINDTFSGDVNLIGGYGTTYQTPYDPNYIDGTYTKISNANQSGYFTPYESIDDLRYNITYDLNGGKAYNTKYFYVGQNDYTLSIPEKEGHIFIGWTGSNGNIPEINVTIPANSTGDKHYVAHYISESSGINIPGPCTFYGGTKNITGENCKFVTEDGVSLNYTDFKYIDTGIKLFTEKNKNKDFEISFTIDSSTPHANNDTIVSSMNEAGSPWPGFVYRINTGTSKFQLRAGYSGNSNWEMPYTSKNIKITRINNVLYYSIDGAAPVSTVNYTNYTGSFDYPVTIGAGLDDNKIPRRYFRGTLSNISVKLFN